jgi:hypothetical protein
MEEGWPQGNEAERLSRVGWSHCLSRVGHLTPSRGRYVVVIDSDEGNWYEDAWPCLAKTKEGEQPITRGTR